MQNKVGVQRNMQLSKLNVTTCNDEKYYRVGKLKRVLFSKHGSIFRYGFQADAVKVIDCFKHCEATNVYLLQWEINSDMEDEENVFDIKHADRAIKTETLVSLKED